MTTLEPGDRIVFADDSFHEVLDVEIEDIDRRVLTRHHGGWLMWDIDQEVNLSDE